MPNNQAHDPRVTLAQDRLAQAVSLAVAAIASGGGSGDLPITVPSFGADEDPAYPIGVVAGSYFVDGDNGSDTNDGIRAEDGGTGPFATVQKACSVLTAGDTCYVRASTTPYSFLGTAYGYSAAAGHRFQYDGTAGNYIRLIGYPGERPVIDQQDTVGGFHLDGREYIQILNFEIRNTLGSGVDCANGYSKPNSNIVVKFCEIHHADGNPGDNVGGIKALGCNKVTFSDNKVYTIRVGGVLNQNGAGFSMYDVYSIKAEHNEIYDAESGVIHKTPPSGTQNVGVFRFNLFHDIERVIYNNNNTGEPAGDFFTGLYVVQNVAYDCPAFLYDTTNNSYGASQTLFAVNNTLYNSGMSIRGFRDARIFNNILSGSEIGAEANGQAYDPQTSDVWRIAQITDIGHNLWDSTNGGLVVNLDIYKFVGSTITYTTLAGLQSGSADTLVDPSPGVGSIVADPLFVDPLNKNFKLQTVSPAINAGRGGVTMGAYISGSETIGATW